MMSCGRTWLLRVLPLCPKCLRMSMPCTFICIYTVYVYRCDDVAIYRQTPILLRTIFSAAFAGGSGRGCGVVSEVLGPFYGVVCARLRIASGLRIARVLCGCGGHCEWVVYDAGFLADVSYPVFNFGRKQIRILRRLCLFFWVLTDNCGFL